MRRALLSLILATPVLALLHGCGATGARFQALQSPPADAALVYLYRPSNLGGYGAFPTVHIGGKPVGELKDGGYLLVTLPPGEHALTLPRSGLWPYDGKEIPLRVAAGRRYFFRLMTTVESRGASAYQHVATMRLVNEAQALPEIVGLNESR